jgi:hypothetical protein
LEPYFSGTPAAHSKPTYRRQSHCAAPHGNGLLAFDLTRATLYERLAARRQQAASSNPPKATVPPADLALPLPAFTTRTGLARRIPEAPQKARSSQHRKARSRSLSGSVFVELAVVRLTVSYLYLTRVNRVSQTFHRTSLGAIPLHVGKARSLPCLKF